MGWVRFFLKFLIPLLFIVNKFYRRIKNRKINVVQTLKRPVPLEHFLYTGQDGRTKKDLFLILNKDGEFNSNKFIYTFFKLINYKFCNFSYKKACEAKKTKEKMKGTNKNAPPPRRYAHGNVTFLKEKIFLIFIIKITH